MGEKEQVADLLEEIKRYFYAASIRQYEESTLEFARDLYSKEVIVAALNQARKDGMHLEPQAHGSTRRIVMRKVKDYFEKQETFAQEQAAREKLQAAQEYARTTFLAALTHGASGNKINSLNHLY